MKSLLDVYVACMNCPKEGCAEVWRDIPGGVPPRAPGTINVCADILVVGKNPGHPLAGEQEYLRGYNGVELLERFQKFSQSIRQNGGERITVFHKNLYRYLDYFLDQSDGPIKTYAEYTYEPDSPIWHQIAFTNLVKCSTKNEQGKLKAVTVDTCLNLYLRQEINLIRPKVIVALGGEVAGFLRRRKSKIDIPIVKIKHPSYFYANNDEASVLRNIKKDVREFLSHQ